MESVRFEKFILLICGIQKHISRLKTTFAPELGIKSVHVLWFYELMMHPDGLTATELATVSMVDRALVSREIESLKADGYVYAKSDDGKSYNVPLHLTEKGEEVAERILELVTELQDKLDSGIDQEELVAFYSTLEKLSNNFRLIPKGKRSAIRKGGDHDEKVRE